MADKYSYDPQKLDGFQLTHTFIVKKKTTSSKTGSENTDSTSPFSSLDRSGDKLLAKPSHKVVFHEKSQQSLSTFFGEDTTVYKSY